MSNVFVYNPQPSYPPFAQGGPGGGGYPSFYNQGSHTPEGSPFIPPGATTPLGGSSPYSIQTPLPPASAPAAPGLGFGGAGPGFGGGDPFANGLGYGLDPRPRKLSWHGASGSGFGGFGSPNAPPPQYLTPEDQDYFKERRRSFGSTASTVPPWFNAPPQQQQQAQSLIPLQINPNINGLHPRTDFLFDLSSPVPNAKRLIAQSNQIIGLSNDELRSPATWPGITKMRIVCGIIPQWPIDISFVPPNPNQNQESYAAFLPPITLQDVLLSLHKAFQTRISHLDWAKLTQDQEVLITKWFNKRCRTHGDAMMEERRKGIRRVDFLMGKVWVRGLVQVDGQGFGGDGVVMKLIVA